MSSSVANRRRRSRPDQSQLELFGDLPSPQIADDELPRAEAPLAHASKIVLAPEQLELNAGGTPAADPTEGSGLAASARSRPDITTLADVIRELDAASMPARRRSELRSAINGVGNGLGRELHDISASLPELGMLLAAANPAIGGMTRYRWTKVRSGLVGALTAVGVDVMPGRDVKGMNPAWRSLYDALPTQRLRCGLSKMLNHLSREGVSPGNVAPSHLDGFRVALATKSLNPAPFTTFNCAARLWNEAVRDIAGWPQALAVIPTDPRRYSLPWDELPEAFRADLAAFLDHSGSREILADDYAPSVREATITGRKKMIRQLASALVLSGFPKEQLTSLAVLAEPLNAKAALRYLIDRNGGQPAPQHGGLATLIRTVARHWGKAPPDQVEVLQKIASALQPKSKGMRPKNRERLRQFDLTENQEALLLLPPRIFEEVRRNDSGGKGEAVRVMMALAIEILIMAPMRRKNITSIEVERHVKKTRRGSKVVHHIIFAEDETKTSVPFELSLPSQSAAMLEAYLEKYRARVFPDRSPYLFPGRGGALRSFDSFSSLLSKFIDRETGLKMHTHLFRGLAAKLHLNDHPEDIETVRRLLGHTTTRATLKAYAELKNDAAFKRYDQNIVEKREQASRLSAARPKSTKSKRAS